MTDNLLMPYVIIYGLPLIVDCGIEYWRDILCTDFVSPNKQQIHIPNKTGK